jgi:MFS family permease
MQQDGAPLTTSLAWATWALFASLALLLVGAGLLATLIAVRADLEGFGTGIIGLVGAAYYGGFLVGSKVTVGALAKVGHIRVFAALASILSASVLTMGLSTRPSLWIAMRFVTGLCLAGQYVVAESWLNHLVTNEARGRLLAVYMVVSNAAWGLGPLLLARVDPAATVGFAVVAVFTTLAVTPVALSEEAEAPRVEASSRLSLRELATLVPTGMGSALITGAAHGAFASLVSLYAARGGLSTAEIGRLSTAWVVGGALLQWPVSSASDDLDRRAVGAMTALGAVGASVLLLLVGPGGWHGLLAVALIGGFSMPLYSIAGAYTNDFVPPEHATAANSMVVLLYGAGALTGPLLGSGAMSLIGNDGFAWTGAVLHLGLALFFVYRMVVWRAPFAKYAWDEISLPARAFFLPATVIAMGRRLSSRPPRALGR